MVDTVTEPHWIALEGAANVRDVGGLPTTGGRLVKQHQLIRADNLQDYLAERPDSVLASLRLMATTAGATVVHCAAGKDRTGVVVAVALDEIGVDRSAIVADYARSSERIAEIVARLSATPVYAPDLAGKAVDSQAVRPQTMEAFFAELDARFGGAAGWLREQGWRDEDHDALYTRLVG
jgi:protein-tyrosine phosphatase